MKYPNVYTIMCNLSSSPKCTSTLTVYEVDYWLENFSDTVFCNGQLRQVKFEKITDRNYKVYTEVK